MRMSHVTYIFIKFIFSYSAIRSENQSDIFANILTVIEMLELSLFHLTLISVVFLSRDVAPFKTHLGRGFREYRFKSSPDQIIDEKPKWASGGVVSDVVNALISFKPLFSIMKIAARRTLINTAEKNGIMWTQTAQNLEKIQEQVIKKHFDCLSNACVQYPDYYTQEFHAYDEGNLNWQAAYECESATMSMALRVWPKDGFTAEQAQDKLRSSFLNAVKMYSAKWSTKTPQKIIDVGCSVGISTFYLADAFPSTSEIVGLDLSPHFLAVAQHRQNEHPDKFSFSGLSRINWTHQNVEKTDYPDGRFDLVAVSFMFHELPQEPSNKILKELHRITAPNGMVAITDNNPKSPVIQGLPPALFTLMKSTEPWSDEYYVYDLEDALRAAGFESVETVATDPRHRTVLAKRSRA